MIKDSDYKQLIDPSNGAPLDNRAIQGEYPTGSTFKLITSTAALAERRRSPPTRSSTTRAQLTVGGITFHNSGGAVNGAIALPQALKVSSDVFFYTLGDWLNSYHDGQ